MPASGLQITRVAVRDLDRARDTPLPAGVFTTDGVSIVDDPDVDVVLELLGGLEPARVLVLRALAAGKPVVTGNKELLASAGAELEAAAHAGAADLAFEAAVAGGIPLIRPLRESLAGDRVTRILGIVNGTTNYILTQMSDRGWGFEQALEEATRLGYAEADPTADVDGFDAAAKCAILASIAFDARVTTDDVYREGITGVTAQDIADAARLGYVVKLLAIAELDHDDITVRVHPAMVPTEHPLASVRDAFNAVFIEAENAGQLMFYGRGAGGEPTATSVVGDLVRVARHLAFGGRMQGAEGVGLARRIRPMGDTHGQYYLNLHVEDRPGVLAEIAEAFGRHGVSIERVWQEGFGEEAALVFITHRAQEAALPGDGDRAPRPRLRSRGRQPAPRGGRGVSPEPVMHGAHQWRGLIEEYRDRLPVSDATPVITLREGGTPLVHSEALSAHTGAEVWLKYDGANPTGSFKDRGMTLAISKAVEEGAEAVVCASTGNTSASAAAYAAKAGLTCAVLVPKGKIAMGKMAATLVHGARMLEVEGNFDASLDLARDLAARYPVTLVNSVNPFRLQGPEDGGVRDLRHARPRPRHPLRAGGQRREHLESLDGVLGVPGRRHDRRAAAAVRVPGGRRRAAGHGRAGGRPADDRHGDPDRQPCIVGPRDRGCARLRGRHLVGHRPPDPGRLPVGRARGAVRGACERRERRRACCRPTRRGAIPAGAVVVCILTGHGLKDPEWAISGAAHPGDGAGRRGDRRRRARPGLVVAIGSARHARLRLACQRPRPTSARGSTRSGSRSTSATSSRSTRTRARR